MPSNPTQSMYWLQALHGNEAKVVDLLCPNPSAGHKTPHACAQRGTLSETFRYAFPRMATAQRQYVYVSVLT